MKAVLAETYERIHRSNLVGMGVIPLQFKEGEHPASLGLTGHEVFDVTGLSDQIKPHQEVRVTATRLDGSRSEFTAIARLDSPVEVNYYRNGGILPSVLRSFLKG